MTFLQASGKAPPPRIDSANPPNLPFRARFDFSYAYPIFPPRKKWKIRLNNFPFLAPNKVHTGHTGDKPVKHRRRNE